MNWRFPAVVALSLLLGACSGMLPQGGLKTGAAEETPTTDDGQPLPLLARLANEIVKVNSDKARAARVCLFSAVAAEVYTFRLEYYGAPLDDISVAYINLSRLASNVAKLEKGAADSPWFNTNMFYAAVGLIRAEEGPVRDRVLGGITGVVTHNWAGLARGLRQGVGQAWLADTMFSDVRRIVSWIEEGKEGGEYLAWVACKTRLQGNLDRLAARIGVQAPPLLRIVPGG